MIGAAKMLRERPRSHGRAPLITDDLDDRLELALDDGCSSPTAMGRMSSGLLVRRRLRRLRSSAGQADVGTIIVLASVCTVVFGCFFFVGRAASPRAAAVEQTLPGVAAAAAGVPVRMSAAPAIAVALGSARRAGASARPAAPRAESEAEAEVPPVVEEATAEPAPPAPAKAPATVPARPLATASPAPHPAPAQGPGAPSTGTPPTVSPTGSGASSEPSG